MGGRNEQPETSTETPTARVKETVVDMEEDDVGRRRTKSENRHRTQNSPENSRSSPTPRRLSAVESFSLHGDDLYRIYTRGQTPLRKACGVRIPKK